LASELILSDDYFLLRLQLKFKAKIEAHVLRIPVAIDVGLSSPNNY